MAVSHSTLAIIPTGDEDAKSDYCGVLRGSGYSHGIAFNTLRFVSLAHRALGVQVVWLECAAATGSLQLEAPIGAPAPLLTAERIETELGVWRTRHSGKCA